MLTADDKINILNEFPDIKLSYAKIIHKKVYNCDYMLAIPEGKKCFAWFRQFKDNCVCFILELDDNNNKINNIWTATSCFSTAICYGTVFYGTVFKHQNNQFFCIEDVFLNKCEDVSRENWKNKMNIIHNLLKTDIKQISYGNSFLVFGLPVIVNCNEKLENNLKNLIKYKISSIQYKKDNLIGSYHLLSYDEYIKITNKKEICPIIEKKEPTIVEKEIRPIIEKEIRPIIEKEIRPIIEKEIRPIIEKKEPNKNIIFEIKPDIQNDIYHLYSLGGEKYDTACIPDYKTSIMMNNLFRIIKENYDLDKLEESDDEDEFENPNIDKFVFLNKSYKFACQFNKRFKKWNPIKIVHNDLSASSISDINNYINKLFDKSKINNFKKYNYNR
jgi:hypothetical protein